MPDWTQIDPSDPATLPTEVDANEWGNCGFTDGDDTYWSAPWSCPPRGAIAFLRNPTDVISIYAPPEKQKRAFYQWEDVGIGKCDRPSAELVEWREGDLDPDAALRLLEAARRYLSKLQPTAADRADFQSAIDTATQRS